PDHDRMLPRFARRVQFHYPANFTLKEFCSISRAQLMRTPFIVLMLCSVLTPMAAQPQPTVNLMPIPTNLGMGTGRVVIDPSFSVAISGNSDPRLQRAVERFLNDLRRQTGMLPLDMKVTDPAKATLVVLEE